MGSSFCQLSFLLMEDCTICRNLEPAKGIGAAVYLRSEAQCPEVNQEPLQAEPGDGLGTARHWRKFKTLAPFDAAKIYSGASFHTRARIR